jgi:hypothetical protein
MLTVAVNRPSARPQRDTITLFICTLGLVAVATGALITMVVFTPRQNSANQAAASYSRGVNQHTTYSPLLRSAVRMNAEIAQLARANSRMVAHNLIAARVTTDHAARIQGNLDRLVPASGRAATLNTLIRGESEAIASLNGHIRSTFAEIERSARSVRAGVQLNNRQNAAVLAASRVIAADQSLNARLQVLILAHTKSVQCSPVVRACGSSAKDAELLRRIPRFALAMRTPRAAARTVARRSSRTTPPPSLVGPPTPPALAPLPRHWRPPTLPILGAVETGAGVSGASGTALGLIAWRRRSRHER